MNYTTTTATAGLYCNYCCFYCYSGELRVFISLLLVSYASVRVFVCYNSDHWISVHVLIVKSSS